jgi:hypothetical protein
MNEYQHAEKAPALSRYDYDDRTVLAVDFGPAAEPSVDVVDGTAIVVVGVDQHEYDVPRDGPDAAVKTFTRNGVVTIEVRG